MSSENLLLLPIRELADRVLAGKLTCLELINSSLDRIEECAGLNAFITVSHTEARKRAAQLDERLQLGEDVGRLAGIPFAVKDNIECAGLPNTAGTRILEHYIPNASARIVKLLEGEGAIVVGKTNLHELAYGITSVNPHYGAVRNPHDTARISGGSSGGTAVAVAAGMVSFGLGTDTGGSLRIPAALTGVVGFRPSAGLYPREGVTPLSRTRDTTGPIGRCVDDICFLNQIIAPDNEARTSPDESLIRIGVPRKMCFAKLDAEVAAASDNALMAIRDSGIQIVDVDLVDFERLGSLADFTISAFEARRDLPSYLDKATEGKVSLRQLWKTILSPDVRQVFDSQIYGDNTPSESDYMRSMYEHRPEVIAAYDNYFKDNQLDAMLFPTTPCAARPVTECLHTMDFLGDTKQTFKVYTANTRLNSMAGIPGISIPMGVDGAGMPLGLELDSSCGRDHRLLEIASKIECILKPGTNA